MHASHYLNLLLDSYLQNSKLPRPRSASRELSFMLRHQMEQRTSIVVALNIGIRGYVDKSSINLPIDRLRARP